MTRAEFVEDVTLWSELLSFCSEHDLYSCEYVYSKDQMDDEVTEEIVNYIRNHSWEDLYGELENLPTGYDYYRRDSSFDYTGLDDEYDFEGYKEDVLNEADEQEIWDNDESEDEEFFEFEEETNESEDELIVEDEPFEIGELFDICSGVLKSISDEEEAKEVAFKVHFEHSICTLRIDPDK